MTSPWIQPELILLLTVGVGGPLLGLLGLLAPAGSSQRAWRVVLGSLGVLATGFIVTAALMGQPPQIWIPPLALVGVCVLFWGLRHGHLQTLLTRLSSPLRSPRYQAACLLAGGPLVAVWWSLQMNSTTIVIPLDENLVANENPAREFEALHPSPAQTDQGREIPLSRRSNPFEHDRAFQVKQSLLLQRSGLTERVIALADGPSGANCHGWVFTGGAYWLPSTSVGLILKDNGYRRVTRPRVGDLAIYRREGEEIAHTGIVRASTAGIPVLVESKWGDLGVFVHPADEHPYCDVPLTYYRSPRRGHLLRGLSGAPSDDPPVRGLHMVEEE